MEDLTEKQKSYGRYLAKLPLATRNSMLANMKKSFRERLRIFVDAQVIVGRQLSVGDISSLAPEVRALYWSQLKLRNPIKYEFLKPCVEAEVSELNAMESKEEIEC